MNKVIEAYNVPEGLLVVAGYPKRHQKYSRNVCAVSSFTKNTLEALSFENPGRKIIVLTTEVKGQEIYEEDGFLIVRCFKRNSPLSLLNVLSHARRFNKVKKVLVEFEFASFGDTITTSFLLPVVWALFLMGKEINLVAHQVLLDLAKVWGHIGLAKRNPLISIFNLGLKVFFSLITLPAKNIIVLEEEFKKRLSEIIGDRKIMVIPHGIDTGVKRMDPNLARKKIGFSRNDYVILYFGYLTWYKGVDFLAKALKNQSLNGKSIKLLIAGGPSFTQGKKEHYKQYLVSLKNTLKGMKNVLYTGFVKEEDIASVFEASDLVILPYRVFMSSSGPLSLAISYKKPFLLSQNLDALTDSFDFKSALDISGVKKSHLFFRMNKTDILNKIRLSMNPSAKSAMISLSENLYLKRSFGNLAQVYDRILTERHAVSAIFSEA